jgi:hypothetical protein
MNVNSAPGPDGFGPAWYAIAWSSIKADVLSFLNSFYTCTVDLDRINRAHIVLLPKCSTATTPQDYRPVSLQNCPVKIITKILTTRLQRHIQQLIDIDQTGFIKGRSISENFVYATELVQHCHKKKFPTVVLKLDFAKAFDSVCWDSLLKILSARGFPDLWL